MSGEKRRSPGAGYKRGEPACCHGCRTSNTKARTQEFGIPDSCSVSIGGLRGLRRGRNQQPGGARALRVRSCPTNRRRCAFGCVPGKANVERTIKQAKMANVETSRPSQRHRRGTAKYRFRARTVGSFQQKWKPTWDANPRGI
jgi:hypothetical protein